LIDAIEKEFLRIHNYRLAVALAAINEEGDYESKRGSRETWSRC